MNIDQTDKEGSTEAAQFGASIWKRFRGPLDERAFTEHGLLGGRLAPVLNRAFITSLAVRAIAEAIGRGTIDEGGHEQKLAPLDVESLLGAIVMLADDLNREVCEVVDVFDQGAQRVEPHGVS